VRCFIAVPLPDHARTALVRSAAAFRSRCDRLPQTRIAWTGRNGLHVTLAFLGELESARAAEAASILNSTEFGQPRFPVEIRGTGQFPPHGRPRVLYARVTRGADGFAALERRVTERLSGLWTPDRAEFTAHVTLGRVKLSGTPLVFAEERDMVYTEFIAERVVLYESILSPRGAEYRPLAEKPLE
jgi:2'-5' RNA ligase